MAKLDFNEEGEKELVEQVFANAVDSLSEEVRCVCGVRWCMRWFWVISVCPSVHRMAC